MFQRQRQSSSIAEQSTPNPPTVEEMLEYLIANSEIVAIHNDETYAIHVQLNDVFGYGAADQEPITNEEDLKKLYTLEHDSDSCYGYI